MRLAQILGDLLARHHRRAPLGKRGLLGRLRRQLFQFLDGVAQPVGLALRTLDLGAMRLDRLLRLAPRRPQRLHLRGLAIESAEGVEQPPVRRGIDQGALVVLAVNFHQQRAELLAAPARSPADR